jgi:ATP-dependent DNA helicase UvrD/PcrA
LFDLSKEQKKVIDAEGNLLVLGGPGSGKTTIAILKAGKLANEVLTPSQKIIFLSFARPTVARIIEALDETDEVNQDQKRLIEIDTYHAFFWQLIKTHGYLLGLPHKISLLTPAAEAIALSAIRNDYPGPRKINDAQLEEKQARELAEKNRLSTEEGRVCFDLFANLAGQVLHGSTKIRKLIGEAYPYVILDEFQDTNAEQWNVVKALGQESELIALADPEQRIYEFIGADPERLTHYKKEFDSSDFNLGDDNYRSGGTQIAQFGNNVLKGKFGKDSYEGIEFVVFPANQNQAYAALKGQVFQARKRLIEIGKKDWSLAILVPTKRMTRTVSDNLRTKTQKLATIDHSAIVEVEAAVLAAEIISFLMQPKAPKGDFSTLVQLVCNFYEGRGGSTPSKTHLTESARIATALKKAQHARANGKKIAANSIILSMAKSYKAARAVDLTGDPDADWVAVREQLDKGACKRLKEVATESRNLRLLDRGSQLRAALSECWRDTKTYADALEIVQRAFVQEHFAMASRPETGVVVMNMHKAKGKQFDEVIIFEGWPRFAKRKIVSNPDRIVRGNLKEQDLSQARQNFRVSITRAKSRTTILTPKNDPCVLFQ